MTSVYAQLKVSKNKSVGVQIHQAWSLKLLKVKGAVYQSARIESVETNFFIIIISGLW